MTVYEATTALPTTLLAALLLYPLLYLALVDAMIPLVAALVCLAVAAGAAEEEVAVESAAEAPGDGNYDAAAARRDGAGPPRPRSKRSSAGGGLRWRDLGVSLEHCPHTTSQALDRYLYKGDAEGVGGGCLDDSVWILHPCSGHVPHGSLCGILGPSGAGKSTLLAALGGTTPRRAGLHLTGSVWYAECAVELEEPGADANATQCRRHPLSPGEGDVAMLTQHDHFFDMLTPRESLEFAAFLESQKQNAKSGANGGKRITVDHKAIAERKLASLGLSDVADRKIGDRTSLDGGRSTGLSLDGVLNHLGSLWSSRRRGGARSRSRNGGGGGLSGGERRRLSVALELVTEPKVFLADEPTTGLDSSQAEKVVQLIAKLAKERDVPSVCTLHQPKSSIYKLLDQFVLLGPGGKMCYAGEREGAIEYFGKIGYECPRDTNPAEYFIDLVTVDTDDPAQAVADKARIDFLHHQFLESCIAGGEWLSSSSDDRSTEQSTRMETSVTSAMIGRRTFAFDLIRMKIRKVSDSIRRFGALLKRSFRQNIRNNRIVMLRLAASVVQAGLFAAIFPSVQDNKSLSKSIADRVALLTFGVVNMSIMSLMKTLNLFAKERGVVLREQMRSSYTSLEYLLAKVLAEIPLDSFFALLFATVLKRLTGLRTSMLTLIKTYCLMTVSSASLGFAVGSIASSVESAMSLGIPIIIIFMVVGILNPSGVDPSEQPNQVLRLLKPLSPIKWAIEALVTSEFRGMVFDQRDRDWMGTLRDLPKMGGLAMVRDGDDVLSNLGLSEAEYSNIMQNLAILSGAYLLMSWLGLSYFGPSFITTDTSTEDI
ncbi:hypothetical protein ACHAWF_007800 [Thalassiosira exigua]